jgi:hypothetical protein
VFYWSNSIENCIFSSSFYCLENFNTRFVCLGDDFDLCDVFSITLLSDNWWCWIFYNSPQVKVPCVTVLRK